MFANAAIYVSGTVRVNVAISDLLCTYFINIFGSFVFPRK